MKKPNTSISEEPIASLHNNDAGGAMPWRRMNRRAKITAAVKASGTTVTQVFGVGPVPGEHGGHPQQRALPGEDVITERGIVVACSRFIVIAGAAHADYLT